MPNHQRTLMRIYDAAMDDSAWQPAIDGIVSHLGARVGALLVRDHGAVPYTVNAVNDVYARLIASGLGQYYMQNLAHLEAAQFAYFHQLRAGEIWRDDDMGIAREVLDQRPDYQFLREHVGIQRRLGFRLNENRGWFDVMTLGFPTGLDRVPETAYSSLGPFLPHLAKSIEIGRTFNTLKVRYNAVLAMLDKVAIGLLLALESGEIVVANREAERILSLHDGIGKTVAGHLILRDADGNAAVHTHIATVARTAAGEADAAERVMRVTRPSGLHPFLIEVTPLRDSRAELERNLRGALVVLVDPDHQAELNIAGFGALYRLTPAETQVCELMIRGHQAPEIAEIRGTSLATARNQIAAVYLKTETRRRGDLIRLVIRTLPPIL